MEFEEIAALVLVRLVQVLAIGCVIAGIFFLAWSKDLTRKLNDVLSRWVSTRRWTKMLEQMRYIDNKFIELRKVLGLISLVLAVILFVQLFMFGKITTMVPIEY